MWRQAHFGAVMSGSLQLPHTSPTGNWGGKQVSHSSLRGDPMEVREFCLDNVREAQSTPHRRSHPPIQHSKCAHQFQCQRTLYVGPHAHRTNVRSPVAYSGSTEMTYGEYTWVLKGTYLSVQLECPFFGNPCKDCGRSGCSCKPGATSGPPDKTSKESNDKTPKGMGVGGPGPPRTQRMPKPEQTQARIVLL